MTVLVQILVHIGNLQGQHVQHFRYRHPFIIKTVSYTHLDVYKRQASNIRIFFIYLKIVKWLIKLFIIQTAVSYTHLLDNLHLVVA